MTILVVCSDTYGDTESTEFETIAEAQEYIVESHYNFEKVLVYTSLTFEIETKVTISEDVNII